ncbi:hypothetical protein M408DRAFT_27218 [Serendipita vermifera MAFF 305830]|uniref:EthD domain-containing protein n=1 Tax=Serendipita vermifera MAFF 305830 TaxID=933852 RepID=A0A0C2WCQ9_SERVB|nr:hypothetical protein M408DRAFT_27218 [Serendipita vermifera MAFF 305830]
MAQPPTTGPVRIVSFFQNNSGLPDEEYRRKHETYREKSIALFKKHNVNFCSQTFTTSIPAEAVGETPGGKLEPWPYNLMITAEFASPQDAEAFWKDPDYTALSQESAVINAAGGKMSFAFAREEVMIG